MENEVALRNDEERGLISDIETAWSDFKQPVIRDGHAHQLAANSRVVIKKYAKQLEEVKKGHTRPIDDLKKQVLAYFASKEAILAAAQRQIDSGILEYDEYLARIRAEEQRKIDEAARKAEAEARAKLEAEALAAIKAGNDAQAVELVEKAEEVRVPAPMLPTPKVEAKGTAFRTILKWEIVSPSEVERELCDPSPSKVAAKVKIVGAKGTVRGVRIWEEKIIAGTR